MAQETEGKVVETSPGTTVAPPVEPPQEPAKTLHTCSHCGAKVVPDEHDTPTGKVHRCPKCGKFMKLETPEERKEEEMGPLPPYEVMLTERVKELLAANLPRVHGIPKKETTKTIAAILDTLNPEAASEPWNLHNHVKNFAPNADDRHLESIIKKIYGELETEGYIRTGRRRHQPSYGGRRREEGYTPSYARERRRDEEEDYEEDYEDLPRRRRRSSRMKVVVDGQEIETDYQGYLAHQTWKREQEEHEDRKEERDLRMKRLEAEIKKITAESGGSKTDPLVKVKVGEETIEVPASQALLYMRQDDKRYSELEKNLEDEREKRHQAERDQDKADMKRLEEKIDGQPSFLEQLEYYERTGQRLGLRQTGRTTMDVLDSFRGDLQTTAQQVLNKLPSPGGAFKPEITRTPNERRKKAETIKERLRKSEEILLAEDELARAAAKVTS